MSQRCFRNYELQTGCGVEACLEVIGGKWKGLILHHLIQHGTLRFSQMQKLKPELSARILTAQLRELEADGVIVRKGYPVVPPSEGQSLRDLIQAMQAWGDGFLVRSKEKSAVQNQNQSHA